MSLDNTIDFKDHIVQYPNRFKQTTISPGVVELVPTWIETPSEIIQPGTPVDEELFEKLKQNITIYQQTFTTTNNQTVINLARHFLVGQSRVSLTIGGVKQYSGQDYTETATNQLTMTTPQKGGLKAEAIIFTASQAIAEDLYEETLAAIEATQAANAAAVNANTAYNATFFNFLTPVSTFSAIVTTYPNPKLYDAVMIDGVGDANEGKIYRWEGTSWNYKKKASAGPINELVDEVGKIKNNQDFTLPITIEKLTNQGRKVKIGIIGDSLAEPAGTGTAWTQLLFDSAYRAQGYYLGDIFGDSRIPTIAEIDNYAVGGQTSHYGMAYIAPEKKLLRSGAYANQNIDGDALYLPPIIQRKYDLMIISYGTNGGEYSDAFLEILIRQLRLSGTEVMLLTSNPRTDNLNFGFGDNYKKLAKSYSSAVADTQAYFKSALASGVSITTLLADTVHSAAEGHKLYAKAISDTLKINKEHYEKGKYPSSFVSDRRIKIPTISGELSGVVFPSAPFVQFIPTNTTGTGANANQANNIKSPINGRYDDISNKMTKLDVGQYADYTSTQFRGVGLIFYNAVNATVELSVQNGTNVFETIGISAGANRAEYRHVNLSKLGFDDFQNRTVRVKCISGTAYIVGLVFYSVGHKQQKSLTKTGTWNTATYYNVFSHYTNTANDSMEFEIEGNGFSIDIFNSNAAGIIELYVDGLKTNTIDLYTTLDDNIYQLRKYGLAYGKHKVKILLTSSTNAKQKICIAC